MYAFAGDEKSAEAIARDANSHGVTRGGKFVAGSFEVAHIPGRLPAVVGRLTGNKGKRNRRNPSPHIINR